MAKPICVIYWPQNYEGSYGSFSWIYEYMSFLNGNEQSSDKYQWNGKFDDYHWFCFYKSDIWEPEFHVFHPQDMTDINVEELKELVLKNIPTPIVKK